MLFYISRRLFLHLDLTAWGNLLQTTRALVMMIMYLGFFFFSFFKWAVTVITARPQYFSASAQRPRLWIWAVVIVAFHLSFNIWRKNTCTVPSNSVSIQPKVCQHTVFQQFSVIMTDFTPLFLLPFHIQRYLLSPLCRCKILQTKSSKAPMLLPCYNEWR